MSRPPANGQRFGSKNGNVSFRTVSICNSRKKVKRDVVMNVEITDNSKEVSGAIHQVGQAIADTGGFLQVRKVSAARSLHGTVAVLYPGRFLRALQPFCVRGNFSSKAAGMRPALRLRRKSLSHLLPGAGPPIGNYPKRILSLARALRNWYNRGSISARRCMP